MMMVMMVRRGGPNGVAVCIGQPNARNKEEQEMACKLVVMASRRMGLVLADRPLSTHSTPRSPSAMPFLPPPLHHHLPSTEQEGDGIPQDHLGPPRGG